MRITLVNPNTNRDTTEEMRAIAVRHAPAGATVDGLTAAFGSALVTTPAALAVAVEAVAALAPQLAEADGVVVSAFGDPGLAALRASVAVPVVGIAEAGMAEAAAIGRFSIVTTTRDLAEHCAAQAAQLGLADRFVSVRLTPGDAAPLMADPAALAAALLVATRQAAADGAQAVVIGGGPLGNAAETIADDAPVPVVAPIPAAMRRLCAALADKGCRSVVKASMI